MTEIQLSAQDETFVEDLVKRRIYKNRDEVVAAGLRLLGREAGKLVELQRFVQEGLDDVEAGRIHHYTSAEEMLDEVKRMSSEKEMGTRY